jgi:hypothetical protein
MNRLIAAAGILLISGTGSVALANNVGENYAWQFETSADKVNKAAIADMIERRENGFYEAPIYNTNIERQYNCSVASTATGNEGTNTNLANAPSTSGPVSDATGNDAESDIDGLSADNLTNTNGQDNSGAINASVDGDIEVSVSGSPNQALNSEQSNTGNQSASIDGSTACEFVGVLN